MADNQQGNSDLYKLLIGTAVSQGGGALLGWLGNRSATKDARELSAWEKSLIESELARRNQIQGMVAPSSLKALGYSNPSQISTMTRQIASPPTLGTPAAQGQSGMVPNTPPSTGGKVLGAVGTGLGAAGAAGSMGLLGGLGGATKVGLGGFSATQGPAAIPGALGLGGGSGLLGLGAATIPVLGGLVAGGIYAANKIGQGRRTANLATQNGGFEQQFDQAMAEAVKRRDSGDVEGAKQVLQQGYTTFMQGIQAFQGQGGNHEKVANQAMSNKTKWDTFASIKQSLGMN